MDKISIGGAAYPFAATDPSNVKLQSRGMTKREVYATHAASAITASIWANPSMWPCGADGARYIAGEAVQIADALIAALDAGE